MKKIVIVLSVLLVVSLLVVGGLWIYDEYIYLPDVKDSKIMYGLEFGASREEVDKVLTENGLFRREEMELNEYTMMFTFYNLDGIDGANGLVTCGLENDKLISFSIYFEGVSSREYWPVSKEKTLKKMYKAYYKAIKDEYKDCFNSKEYDFGEDYKGDIFICVKDDMLILGSEFEDYSVNISFELRSEYNEELFKQYEKYLETKK